MYMRQVIEVFSTPSLFLLPHVISPRCMPTQCYPPLLVQQNVFTYYMEIKFAPKCWRCLYS